MIVGLNIAEAGLGACRILGIEAQEWGKWCQFFANLRRTASYLTKFAEKWRHLPASATD
jgi:hypothetical protein